MNFEKHRMGPDFQYRLSYIYRAIHTGRKRKSMPSQVYHLGGGVINRPNVTLNEIGEVSDYDIGPLLTELNMQACIVCRHRKPTMCTLFTIIKPR